MSKEASMAFGGNEGGPNYSWLPIYMPPPLTYLWFFRIFNRTLGQEKG